MTTTFKPGDHVIMARPGVNYGYKRHVGTVGRVRYSYSNSDGDDLLVVDFPGGVECRAYTTRFDLVTRPAPSQFSIELTFPNVEDAIKAAELISPVLNVPVEVKSR